MAAADLDDVNEPTLAIEGGGPNPLPSWLEAPFEPTVNVSPDIGLLNDPKRVGVPPAPAGENDPTRNVLPQGLEPLQPRARLPPISEPAVNVLPEPGVVNDPDRVFKAREEAQGAPTVNAAPDGRATDPGGSIRTDPFAPREPTLRTDPDASLPPPFPRDRAEATVQLDLPAEAKVLTSARGALPGGVQRVPVPLGEQSHPGHVVPQPRPSPQRKLDGVAPLVPIQQFPHIGPAIDVTARTDPATLYGAGPPPGVPISVLADVPANAPVVPPRSPVDQWKQSPEVAAFEQDASLRTRVVPKSAATSVGLRPPNSRDIAVILVGFVIMCIGMVLARRETNEGLGPMAPEKIKPPDGFVAPKPVKESSPYVSPDEKLAQSWPTPVKKNGSSSASPGAVGSADYPALAAGAGVAPPPTRMSLPRCHLNVPAALDAKARWVVEGNRKLLELRVTPSRLAIQKANLFIASASHPELAKIERTENAAVFFVVLLDPEPTKKDAKVVLDCECGFANAEVLATIDKKDLKVDLKYAKVTPPEVLAARAKVRR